jgi:DNA polymerase II large subunit
MMSFRVLYRAEDARIVADTMYFSHFVPELFGNDELKLNTIKFDQ